MDGIILKQDEVEITFWHHPKLNNEVIIKTLAPPELLYAIKFCPGAFEEFIKYAGKNYLWRPGYEIVTTGKKIIRYRVDYTQLVGIFGSFFYDKKINSPKSVQAGFMKVEISVRINAIAQMIGGMMFTAVSLINITREMRRINKSINDKL